MTLEAQIQALLTEAEPLRALDEDDPARERLASLVDGINKLRELQAREAATALLAEMTQPKRGPSRPKKEQP